jgi:hypothetical protein
MNTARRITANLPADLLEEAKKTTGEGITETLIQGLKLLKRSYAYEQAMKLKGKLRLNIDLGESRERCRR